jgi:hypothetical protein
MFPMFFYAVVAESDSGRSGATYPSTYQGYSLERVNKKRLNKPAFLSLYFVMTDLNSPQAREGKIPGS